MISKLHSLNVPLYKKVFNAVVVQEKLVAEGVKIISFKIDEPFEYKPWQYVWVELPELKINDVKGNRRAFSILNAYSDDNTIQILFRTGENGYKQSLMSLHVGDRVRIHGPFGSSFVIEEDNFPKNIVMIAGGLGIAAFIPMLQVISKNKFKIPCLLIYVNSKPESTPMLAELAELKQEISDFEYEVKYAHFDWNDVKEKVGNFEGDIQWWITGKQEVVDQVYTELAEAGVPRLQMYFENYYPTLDNSLTKEIIDQYLTKGNIFASAIQNSTNHSVITDPEGKVLFANKAAQEITGYSLEEIIGNTPRLWGGMMSGEFYKDFWRRKMLGKPFEGEVVNRRKNGELYYAIVHIAPIFGEDKQIIGFIGTEEDVTEFKLQSEKIAEDEQRLKFALEGNRDGLWDWQVQTGEVYFSLRWKEMLGYTDTEIKNRVDNWQSLVYPDDLPEVKRLLQDHLDNKSKFYECTHRMVCKDGSNKWILARGMVTERDSDGKAVRAVGTHTDITTHKQLENDLRSATTRLSLASSSAKIGIWEWDLADNKMIWDDQMYHLYGVRREKFSGAYEAWQSGLHPDDKAASDLEIKAALAGEKEFNTTFRVIWENGEVHWIRAFGLVLRDENQNPLRMIGVNFDITNEKLKELEGIRSNIILESMGEGLVITDEKGMIVNVNKSFENITGWRKFEVIGKDMLEVLPKYDEHEQLIPREARSLYKIINDKLTESRQSTFSKTHCYQIKNGTKIPILGVVTPVVHGDKLVGAVQVFRDITNEKAIDQMKDEFLSIASHELRTPMTAIDGLIDMILSGEYGEIPDNIKQPLTDVGDSSSRLINLVNDLLNVSRLQAGRMKYNITQFGIGKTIKGVAESLKILANRKGLELSAEVGSEMTVVADEDKVKQILNNLIGNSLKFTDTGGIKIMIGQKEELMEIRVVDTGVGLKPEDQEKLFIKFQQFDAGNGRPVGTGLGLFISKEMCQAMGGDLYLVSSEPGKGSIFAFTLPLAKPV